MARPTPIFNAPTRSLTFTMTPKPLTHADGPQASCPRCEWWRRHFNLNHHLRVRAQGSNP
jgi:hypothetical protein